MLIRLAPALLMLLLLGCAPYQPKISVEQAPEFNEDRYAQWNFAEPLAVETAGYPAPIVTQFKAAIEAAMLNQGYRRSDTPELIVNVAANISEEGDAALQSDAYQAIHVQRGTFHDSWRGYGEGYGASTRQQRFGEGSINIGVIDSQELELLWEAVATGRLSGDRSEEELASMIDAVTRQMLSELPRGSQ